MAKLVLCFLLWNVIQSTYAANSATESRLADIEKRMNALELENAQLKTELDLIKNAPSIQRRQMGEPFPTIAFSARMTNHVSGLGHQHTVQFGTVRTNIGEAYDNVTSVFIAPEDGVYVFFANIMSETGNGHEYIETEIVKNGDELQLAEMYSGGSTSFDSTSNMAVTALKRGDHVWVRVHGGWSSNFAIHCCFSTFSGFLLSYYEEGAHIVG